MDGVVSSRLEAPREAPRQLRIDEELHAAGG
jgi:hypothetical protein